MVSSAKSLEVLPPAFTVDDEDSCLRVQPFKTSILSLFEMARREDRPLYIAAPMVRYSRLPFRLLVQRHFAVDISYTPMMIAREFKNSKFARTAEFSTCELDGPIIAQFGAAGSEDIVSAPEYIENFVSGVGINCGCPIKDQNQDGIGAVLMQKIDVVEDMVKSLRQRYGAKAVLEVKIRIHADLTKTVEFVRRLEQAGTNVITIHGRLHKQRSSTKPNLEAIRLVREALSKKVYVVANGDCFSLEDARRIFELTGVDGVMSARGLLENPALFAGYESTPWKAVELFWAYAEKYGGVSKNLLYRNVQFMIIEMTQNLLTKEERQEIRTIKSWTQLTSWFDERFVLKRWGEKGFATLEFSGYRKSL
ncbi:hypothetical protein V1512DRAFT_254037 [Lipomyces arxii]|uniref:uncharacterized protein n=1 Tax=Lipomyces arxii TaxID=56418 RepID=UPI0034D000AB